MVADTTRVATRVEYQSLFVVGVPRSTVPWVGVREEVGTLRDRTGLGMTDRPMCMMRRYYGEGVTARMSKVPFLNMWIPSFFYDPW